MIEPAPPPAAANPWLSHTVLIDDIAAEIDGVATYRLRFRDGAAQARYRFRPGQFNMLYLPGTGEIAISVSGGAADRTWDHTIRLAGNVTRQLARLGVGASLGLRGPYGSSWPLDACRGANLLFVAGGIGLAPLRPAIRAVLAQPSAFGKITVLIGARNPASLLYAREQEAWRQAGCEVQTTVDRSAPGWTGNVGVVPLLLDRLQPWSAGNMALFACGPEVMMRYTVRSALARGLPKEQIWVSLERNMQCAVGLCGHCQLGPAFVCQNGPVFRYDQIEPYLSVDGL